MELDYEQKYLKYKQKYLELQKQQYNLDGAGLSSLSKGVYLFVVKTNDIFSGNPESDKIWGEIITNKDKSLNKLPSIDTLTNKVFKKFMYVKLNNKIPIYIESLSKSLSGGGVKTFFLGSKTPKEKTGLDTDLSDELKISSVKANVLPSDKKLIETVLDISKTITLEKTTLNNVEILLNLNTSNTQQNILIDSNTNSLEKELASKILLKDIVKSSGKTVNFSDSFYSLLCYVGTLPTDNLIFKFTEFRHTIPQQ